MRLFAETLAIIVNGELTQLFTSKGLASREDYYQRIYAKTASMFELCTAAAALLSPVDAQEVEVMRRLGYNLGMAFQIMDDILDFTGEQATVGKPVASDLRQGLVTLPALYYLEQNPDDAAMTAVLNGKLYEDEKFARLVSNIRTSGAIEASLQEAEKYIDCAVETLLRQRECPQRQALLELANYIIQRDL
jgi:geranylgeranyl pyrophosphate synthase